MKETRVSFFQYGSDQGSQEQGPWNVWNARVASESTIAQSCPHIPDALDLVFLLTHLGHSVG